MRAHLHSSVEAVDFQAGDIDAIAEEQLHPSTDSPREAAARDAMAAALVAQIDLLRDADGSALVRGRPAVGQLGHQCLALAA